jgi:hypothetical protein
MTAPATKLEAAPWDPPLPNPRGPLTELLFKALIDSPTGLGPIPVFQGDPLSDDDLQLALYVCYETHYRGFQGVDGRWEWDPSLLGFRARLEHSFETALRERFTRSSSSGDVTEILAGIANEEGPPLSRYLRELASLSQFKDYLVHRSAYQLKEADPHSWVIPRLEGKPKAALVEVEFDEYGCGQPERIHAVLYRNTMEALDLDCRYGAYLDLIPGVTLAAVNLMSYFGLHRRLRGASVGHLAIAELTSCLGNKYVGRGLKRLGYGEGATHFFDEHVIADSIHDMVTLHDLAGGLADQDPRLTDDILFGASAWTGVDAAFGQFMLDRWARGEPSLLKDLGVSQ